MTDVRCDIFKSGRRCVLKQRHSQPHSFVDFAEAVEALRPVLAKMGCNPNQCRFYLFERVSALYADVGVSGDYAPWNRLLYTPWNGWMCHDGRLKL